VQTKLLCRKLRPRK